MKILFFLVAVFAAVFSGEATAAPGLPMVTSPLTSGDDLATRIETGNGLATGADYVSAFGQVRPELGISNPAAAAEEARGLHPCNPPAGKYLVSRVKDGKTSTRVRPVSSQEQALCDENGNVIALSKCGNISKPVEVSSPPPIPVTVSPPPATRPQFTNWSWQEAYVPDRAFEECPAGSSCGQWHETGRTIGSALITGGAIVGGAALLPASRTVIRNTVGGLGGGGGEVSPVAGGGPVNPPDWR